MTKLVNHVISLVLIVMILVGIINKPYSASADTNETSYDYYFCEIPEGFDTTHELYKKYETKRLYDGYCNGDIIKVTEPVIEKFIYYHYCFNNQPLSDGCYNVFVNNTKAWEGSIYYCYFTAFESAVDAGNIDPNGRCGGEYCYIWRNIPSDGSWWWIRVPVYYQVVSIEKEKTPVLNATNVKTDINLEVKLNLINAKKAVTWSSSNTKVASVNGSGTVKALSKGTATITAKSDGKSYTCKVTVTANKINVTIAKLKRNETYYVKTDNIGLKTGPYADNSNIAKMKINDPVKVIWSFTNEYGNTWYKTDKGFYIYSGHLSKTKVKGSVSYYITKGGKTINIKAESVEFGKDVTIIDLPSKNKTGDITFWGWAANSETPNKVDYTAGDAINVTENLKLYAVINECINVKGAEQVYDDTPWHTGLCTISSLTTLLRRRQAYIGKIGAISFGSVNAIFGGSKAPTSANYYSSNGGLNKCSCDMNLNNTTYHMNSKSGNFTTADIKEMLDEHPEGIMIYFNYRYWNKTGWAPSPHAIVLTGYVTDKTGNSTFWCCDPVDALYYGTSGLPIVYERSYSCSQKDVESIDKLIAATFRVYYLE